MIIYLSDHVYVGFVHVFVHVFVQECVSARV